MPERPDLDEAVGAVSDRMVDVRREVHRHPELGFQEVATTRLVVDELLALGLTQRACPTPTGAVFELQAGRPGRTVVLRADLDALPVQEPPTGEVVSQVEGCMHACGHDAHTAAMLGVAAALASRRDDLAGRFVFVFQPAEEALGGGRAMVDGGVLDGLDAVALVGCHVTSFAPVGTVALRAGVAMSEVHSFRVEARGAGGHGALSGTQGNVLRAVAALAGDLDDVVDGLSLDGTACACSAGELHAGTAANVVPSTALLRGTLRTFDAGQSATSLARLDEACARLGADFSCELRVVVESHAPAVVNDVAVTDVVARTAARTVGPDAVLRIPPVTPSDDVSEFLARVPGCYFFVGAGRPDGSSGPHHSPTFAIDEGCLPVAARVLAGAAADLAEPASG